MKTVCRIIRKSIVFALAHRGLTIIESPVAKAMYGDASRWREIFEANQDTISNPDLIEVGQELRIP